MSYVKYLVALSLFLALPAVSQAYGPHETLSCTGCHGIHTAKGELIFAVEPNTKVINARTGKPFTGASALCLGCHETPENGGMGIRPVSTQHSHPISVVPNPKVASVPEEALRNGVLECVGCHDPHPSNPNYRYLRVDTNGGANMQNFCAMCHKSKVDPKAVKDMKIFSSMDERK